MSAIRHPPGLFRAEYDSSHWRPKHHYVLHLPMMLSRFGTLLCCFVQERKHRVIKRHTRFRQNTTAFEVGTIEEVTLHQIHDMQGPWAHCGLCEPRKLTMPELRTVREFYPRVKNDDLFACVTAIAARGKIHVGDVAYLLVDGDRMCCEILMLLEVEGSFRAVVSLYTAVARTSSASEHVSKFSVPAHTDTRVVPGESLLQSLVYSRTPPSTSGVGCVVVLNPGEFR